MIPAVGQIFVAPWGRYVYTGSRVDGGRVPLQQLGDGTTFVMVDLARLGIDYVPDGEMPTREAGSRRHEVVVAVPTGADDALDLKDVAATPTSADDALAPSEVPTGAEDALALSQVTTPTSADDALAPTRHATLGAHRPPAQLGTVHGVHTSAAVVSLPAVDRLAWQPCWTRSDTMPVPGVDDDIVWRGKEGHVVAIPHAHFIASNQAPTFFCPACLARRKGEVLPLPVRASDTRDMTCSVATATGAPDAPDYGIPLELDPAATSVRDALDLCRPCPTTGASTAPDNSGHVPTSEDSLDENPPVRAAVLALAQPVEARPSPRTTAHDLEEVLARANASFEQKMQRREAGRASTPPAPSAPTSRAPARREWVPIVTLADLQRKPAWLEFWTERAAIREYVGGMSRAAADASALDDVRDAIAQGVLAA